MFEEEFMQEYFIHVQNVFEIVYTNEMLHQFLYYMSDDLREYNAGLLITCFQLLFHCLKY